MVAGFRSRTRGSSSRSDRDYSKAIPIQELNLDEFDYGDIGDSELQLPIGLFLPREKSEGIDGDDPEAEEAVSSDWDRLVDFEFVSNIADTEFELTLERYEQTAKRDFSKHISKLGVYFAKAVKSIGGLSLDEISKRMSCSKQDIFTRMWTADVVTLVLGARYAINQDRLYKLNIQCGCDKKTTIESDPENGVPLQSLDSIRIKYFNNESYPLFLIELPEGFHDGKGQVNKLYFEPLKLYQTSKLTERAKGTTDRTTIITQMCVGMPDSEVYGQKRGKVLTQDVMIEFNYSDRRYLDAAIGEINFGPEPQIKVQCPNCIEMTTVDHYLNWLVQTTNVLYGTGSNTLINFD